MTEHPDPESVDLVRLCKAAEIAEGKPIALEPDGFPPLAAYRVGDEYFVTDNICTHAYSLLTEGFQNGASIECEVHGGTFDIPSGAATGFPCRVPLKTYEVRVIDGWLLVCNREPEEG